MNDCDNCTVRVDRDALRSLEAWLAQMREALNCGDVGWAQHCWQGAVEHLANIHPDAADLLGGES